MAYAIPSNVASFQTWWEYLDVITNNMHSVFFIIVIWGIAFIASKSYANADSRKSALVASFISMFTSLGIWTIGSLEFKWLILPALAFAVCLIIQKKGVEVGG